MSRISAGEAYVSVSVENKSLLSGLNEASQKIRESARTFSASSSALNPTLSLKGSDAFAASLREVRREAEQTANAAKKLSDRFVITAGDIYNAFRGLASTLSNLLGGIGDDFDKMAARTGLSADALSEYAYAAKLSGATINDVESAMRSLASSLVMAQNGSERARKGFDILGLDIERIASLSPERQFEEVARAISSIADPTERAGAALKIFGSAGANLLPLFSQGPDGLAKIRKEARDLGVSIDQETATMGASFEDATVRLKSAVQGVGLSFAKILTPALTDVANKFSRALALVNDFVKENPALATSFTGVGLAIGTLAAGTVVATHAYSALAGSIATVSKALNALKVASLANPWTALAVAIGAAVAAITAYNALASKTPKFSTEGADALASGEEAQRQDRAALERLQTLEKISRSHRLSNEEVAEGARLAEELRQKYGDVGISVDAVTGKIRGAIGAQGELNEKLSEARANWLRGAIAEAEANESSGAIESKLLQEEVGTAETLFGKKRDATWGQYIAEMLGGVSANGSVVTKKSGDDARREILGDNEDFAKKLQAALQKNRAQIEMWKAELDALTTSARATTAEAIQGPDAETIEKASSVIADFIDEGTEKEESALDRKIRTIREKRDRLIEELRKLADPDGNVDWNDANAVDSFLNGNANARAIQNQALAVDESARAQIARAQAEDRRQKEAEEARARQEQERIAREEAKRKADGDKELADVLDQRFDKFASPYERLERAQEKLQEALSNLAEAQKTGDNSTIAGALRRLGEAEDKYTSIAELVDKTSSDVGRAVGGTFSAWQATTSASVDWNKQELAEQKTQTSYLRQIYAVLARRGNNGAVFA